MANDLTIFIDADTSGLRQGMNEAERQVNSFQSRIQGIADVGSKLASLGATLTAGLTLPIVGLGVAAVNAYGDIQSLQKGLEAVMGSAGAASREFDNLKEVAKLPGLGMKEAVQGSINLQAIGISAGKSRNILQQFGNAVATVGKGRVEFERAIYGVQQLANTDFPLGEDLNIIKDALPQVSNLLKDAFGSSRSDELAKMGVSSQQVLDTILAGLGKLPRVTGGIKGAFENLGDAMTTNLARIGKIIDKNIDISGLIDKITGFVDKVVSAFENLDPAFQTAILGVAGFAAAMGPLLVTVGGFMALLPTLKAGVSALGLEFTAMTGPIGLVVIGIGAIIAAVVTDWDKIDPYIQGTVDWFKRLNAESFAVRTTVQGIGFAFNALGMIAIEVVKNIWQNFRTLGKGLLELFAGVGGVIEGAITLDWEKVKSGYSRGMQSISNAVVGVAVNSANSFNTVLSKMDSLEKKWSSWNINSVSMPGLDKAVEKEADEKIIKGLNAASGKIKKIELPDVEPIAIKGGSVDKLSFLGMMFGTPLEMENYINGLIDTTEIGLGRLSTALSQGQAKLLQDAQNMQAITDNLNSSLKNLVVDSISGGINDMFSSIGSALASGQDVVGAIGQSLIGMFTGFLSSMGKLLIEYGTLAIVKGSLDTIIATGGPQAVAAGIAAIAVGAALSLAGGALGTVAKGGFNGSSGVSSATGSSSTSSYSSNYSSGGSGGGEYVFRISGNDLVAVLARNQDKNSRLNAG